jgi:hypothetical protein
MFFLLVATIVSFGNLVAQEIVITGFQNGHLSFSNSLPAGHRTVYSLEWRSNLGGDSPWLSSWSDLEEFSDTDSLVTVDAPMFYRVAAYPDNLTTNANQLWLMYSNAVLDAASAQPSEVCDKLTPIVLANTNLTWRTNQAGILQVKVCSFMTYKTATNYYQPGEHLLSYGDQWITVCPELRNFCSGFAGPDQPLRIKQVLGMPPTAANDTVVEFWVSPDYLFRPTPEPAIGSTTAGTLSSPDAPLLTPNLRIPAFWVEWYNATYSSRNYDMTDGVYNAWPWTQLGYTYDWASTSPNHAGLSEFVIPSGTLSKALAVTVPIEVEAILPAATYGKP